MHGAEHRAPRRARAARAPPLPGSAPAARPATKAVTTPCEQARTSHRSRRHHRRHPAPRRVRPRAFPRTQRSRDGREIHRRCPPKGAPTRLTPRSWRRVARPPAGSHWPTAPRARDCLRSHGHDEQRQRDCPSRRRREAWHHRHRHGQPGTPCGSGTDIAITATGDQHRGGTASTRVTRATTAQASTMRGPPAAARPPPAPARGRG